MQFKQALELLLDKYGEKHEIIAKLYSNIALVYKEQHRYEESIKTYEKSLAIYKALQKEESNETATILGELASAFKAF